MSPVWLVTGAGSGVGRALAVALASSGARVVLTARNQGNLANTAQWCPGSTVIPSDLADFASVDALVRAVKAVLLGAPLAGIVHAAGVMLWDSPTTPSLWSRVPLVNALAPWRLTLSLEDELLAAGGRVLFVAGAPFTLQGVEPDLALWRGDQPGRGLRLALEAAAAKVWAARELHRRWSGRASAFAFHPGFVKSSLADQLPFPLNTLGCLAQPFLAARCRTGEFLSLDERAPGLSGQLVSGHRGFPQCPTSPDSLREAAWLSQLPV